MSDLMQRLRAEYGTQDGIARWMAKNARDREFAAWCRYVLNVRVSNDDWPELRSILVPLDDPDRGRARPSGLTPDDALTLAVKKWNDRKKTTKKERA